MGGDGDDTLTGSDQVDILYGDGGDDDLRALGGDDLLNGGTGDDNLNGGAGKDTFAFGDNYGVDRFKDAGEAAVFNFSLMTKGLTGFINRGFTGSSTLGAMSCRLEGWKLLLRRSF